MCVNAISQLNFLEKKGQFFEQGYGRNLDEEAMDLLQDGNNTVMCGWQTFFKTGNKNFTLWRINQYGKQLSEFNFHDNWDNIATGIAKNTANTYILCGRSTPTYIPESIVEVGDSIKVLKVDTAGNIIWKFTYGRPDEGLAATDVFSTSGNDIYVIGNRKQLSNGRTSIFFLRLSANGQLHWIENYNHRTNSITTHEMSPYNTNQYILSINQESGGGNIPMLLVFDHNANVVNVTAYTQLIKSNWYGIAIDGSNNIWLAGYEYQSTDTNGWIVKLNNNLSVNFSLSTGTQGTEKYKDISLTPVGYICLGTATNQGEGGNDVYMVHYDHQNKVTLKETLGTAEHERANSLMIRNLPEPVAQFAGYCKGYGVAESGNAYLGATLYYEIGTLLNGQNCEVPRVIFLDNLITGRNNNTGLIEKDILGDNTKEDAFIDFCVANNINVVPIYKLGFVFGYYTPADPAHSSFDQNILNDRNLAKAQLNNFIAKCHQNNIRVGYIADQETHALQQVANNNLDFYNYTNHGKFSFIELEHEFWNASITKTISGHDLSNPPFPSYNFNDHFTALYVDHIMLLDYLNTSKIQQGNIWKVFDYVDKYYNSNFPNSSENFNNTTARRNKVNEIASLTDAIITTHYQEYHQNGNTYEGTNFLFPENSNFPNIEKYRTRLSDFGNNQQTVNIIPTFSAEFFEYDYNNPTSLSNINNPFYCGEGYELDDYDSPTMVVYYYDYLGKFLDGPPYNNTYNNQDFYEVELRYLNQHEAVIYNVDNQINNFHNLYPNIRKANIAGFAWFKYSCVQNKTGFLRKQLNECRDFTNPVSIEEMIGVKSQLNIYPNPVYTNHFTIEYDSNSPYSVSVYNLSGQLKYRNENVTQGNIINVSVDNWTKGMYIVQIVSQGASLTTKIIIH